MMIEYSERPGNHRVAVIVAPSIAGNQYVHFSTDGARSWVIRDFRDLRIEANDRPDLTMRKIEQAVTCCVRKVDIPDRPVSDESSWRDYLERKTKELG